MPDQRLRSGDVLLERAPAPNGPMLTFIGHVRSAHADTATAPKNPAKARERGDAATLVIDPPYRPGLVGLAAYSHVIVLGWLHQARRDVIQITRPALSAPSVAQSQPARAPSVAQSQPARAPSVAQSQPAPAPKGVFALRSPVRPNPISVSVARILSVDIATGEVVIDAIDLLDGTPIVDVKPYRPGIDAVPDAVVP